jgi:hypothetical protein
MPTGIAKWWSERRAERRAVLEYRRTWRTLTRLRRSRDAH